MPACWKQLMEEERRMMLMLAKIDEFPGWTVEHVKSIVLLGFVHLDDIQKMREGCYLMTKEDDSVFVTPIIDVSDDDNNHGESTSKRRWMLNQDYAGFAFAPSAVIINQSHYGIH
jgi:hypothetical protein